MTFLAYSISDYLAKLAFTELKAPHSVRILLLPLADWQNSLASLTGGTVIVSHRGDTCFEFVYVLALDGLIPYCYYCCILLA